MTTAGTIPESYVQPFWLEGPVGNNAFAYDRRGPSPRLWVPPLVDGTVADVVPGTQVVFEDVDEHGTLQSCTGLATFVRTVWDDVPTIVVDNHNHVFAFWIEAFRHGHLEPGATLVHLDQHRDTRVPARGFDATWTPADTFRYTNIDLNVGNYIEPARRAGLIGEALFATGSSALDDRRVAGQRNLILNIDLDFFAPEMAYIDFETTRRFVDAHRRTAAIITIATSPFFIDQTRAIAFLQRLMS
ncbi:MAG: hypothetical protein ABS36_18320 [Acidobacteria bacterium SCN 69-37]|nr:MAG: hypothetical protein ABS36_18320 [Acidobacteria bacterium SCN 69-37]